MVKLTGTQKLGKGQKALDMHYTTWGELGKESGAKKGSGASMSAMGKFNSADDNYPNTINAAKKGTGGDVQKSIDTMAKDHRLYC